MGKHHFWLILAGKLLITAGTCAQPVPDSNDQHVRYLVLERQWPHKRLRFYPGQHISFKLRGEPGWNRGPIQAVYKHKLIILNAEIPFLDIRRIKTSRSGYLSNFASLSSASLVGGGALWIALGGIREIEGTGEGGEWLAGAGAGAILMGLAARSLTRQSWRVGGRYKLKSF